MNLATLKKSNRLSDRIQVCVPDGLRDKAKMVARQHSTDSVKVNESDVYRAAIEKFLSEMDTKCIRNEVENVTDRDEAERQTV